MKLVLAIVLASHLTFPSTQPAASPPSKCKAAIRSVQMTFDETRPEWSKTPLYKSLINCRRADWLSLARTRVSRYQSMEDYNYYREPAIVLRGRSLSDFLRFACRSVQLDRGTDGHYLADLAMIACGERPGVASSQMKPIPSSTTTTAAPQIPKPIADPTVFLNIKYDSINSWEFSFSGVSSWRGRPIQACLKESGIPFDSSRAKMFNILYDEEQLSSSGACTTFSRPVFNRNEPNSFNEYGPISFLEAVLTRSNVSDVAKNICGIDWNSNARFDAKLCATQTFTLSVLFQDGSTATSQPVQMFIIIVKDGYIGWTQCDPKSQTATNCTGPHYRVP